MTKRPKKPNWDNVPNARRHRPMISLTLAPETITKLDELRGERSRGVVIDELVRLAGEEWAMAEDAGSVILRGPFSTSTRVFDEWISKAEAADKPKPPKLR